MNQFRQFVARFTAQVPNMAAGGGPAMPKGGGTAMVSLLALGAGSYGLYNSMVTIQPGHAGLIYSRIGGLNEDTVLTEGLNFVIPWFQRAIVFDVRTRPQPIDTQSGSKGTPTNNISFISHISYPLWYDMVCRLADGADLSAGVVQA
jgi:regulator of protease activity HflC (stomatin/prohibitin superfamily)